MDLLQLKKNKVPGVTTIDCHVDRLHLRFEFKCGLPKFRISLEAHTNQMFSIGSTSSGKFLGVPRVYYCT